MNELSGLLGVAVGGAIGFLSSLGVLAYQRRTETKTLAAALCVELEYVLKLLDEDDPFEDLKRRRAGMDAVGPPVPPIYVDERDYRLFLGGLAQIGLLPKALAGSITEFYSRLARRKEEIDTCNRYPGHGGLKVDFEARLLEERNNLVSSAKMIRDRLLGV